MIEPKSITIENLEDLTFIYIRFRGSYAAFRKQSRKMFNELFEFATKNELIIQDETKVLTIYDDNPFITDAKNLRTSVAMTIPKIGPFRKPAIFVYRVFQENSVLDILNYLRRSMGMRGSICIKNGCLMMNEKFAMPFRLNCM